MASIIIVSAFESQINKSEWNLPSGAQNSYGGNIEAKEQAEQRKTGIKKNKKKQRDWIEK